MNDKNQMDSTNVATRGSLVKVAFGSEAVVKHLFILANPKSPGLSINLPFGEPIERSFCFDGYGDLRPTPALQRRPTNGKFILKSVIQIQVAIGRHRPLQPFIVDLLNNHHPRQ